jgi:hypothetical protein
MRLRDIKWVTGKSPSKLRADIDRQALMRLLTQGLLRENYVSRPIRRYKT